MSGLGWKAVGGVLAIGSVGWGAFNVVSLVAHEERTEITTYDAADVSVLDVANSSGSVTITGAAARDEVTVTARIGDGLRETEERQTLVDGVLELRASCPLIGSEWCDVDYEIAMPRHIDVLVRVDDGSLDVSNVDGDVDADNDSGSIDLSDLTGPVTVSNDDGRITGIGLRSATVDAENDSGHIELTFVTAPMTVVARTDDGSVEVVVPETPDGYHVDQSTDDGSESNDVGDNPDSSRSLTLETDSGDVTLRPAP